MRISDWSSDVCSSDLRIADPGVAAREHLPGWPGLCLVADELRRAVAGPAQPTAHLRRGKALMALRQTLSGATLLAATGLFAATLLAAIGRGSCRERVCQYV